MKYLKQLVRSLYLAVMLGVLVPLTAIADLPPAPSITSDRGFVGDVLRGIESGDAGVLYQKNVDSPDGNASTTKTFTLLLAAEAIDAGLADYDDAVPISANAQIINHDHGAMNGPAIAPGTLFRLEDLLTTMILDSDADATVSVAEHIAKRTNPIFVDACMPAPALCDGSFWENIFVTAMNDRAIELGLEDTLFFNPYGGDHGHDAQGKSTGAVPHETTAREMAKWMDFAMKNATFRDIIGRQGTFNFEPVGGGAVYSAGSSFGYPGTLGQKGGNSNDCGQCFVNMTERIGRKLVMTYMQGIGGEGTIMLDYGFAKLFHPEFRGESEPYGQAQDHSLSCVASNRAASAVVTSEGEIALHLFSVAAGGASIRLIEDERRDPTRESDDGDFSVGVGGDPKSGDLAPEDRDGEGDGGGVIIGTPGGKALQVDLTYAQNGHLALGVTRESILELSSWGIPGDGPAFYRSTSTVGTGTDLQVYSPHPGRVITVHRDDSGDLEIGSWIMDATDGSLQRLFTLPAFSASEFRMTGQDTIQLLPEPFAYLNGSRFMIAAASSSGSLEMHSYRALLDGSVAAIHSTSLAISGVQHVRVARVLGRHHFNQLYAVAYRGSGDGDLEIQLVQADYLGQLGLETSLTLDSYPIDIAGSLEIAPYRDGGIFIGRKSSPNIAGTDFLVLAIDADANGLDSASLIVDQNSGLSGDLVGLCRIPGNKAEGDFLLAEEDFFDSQLRLAAWRSGPRGTACGLGFEAGLFIAPLIWRRRRRSRISAGRDSPLQSTPAP